MNANQRETLSKNASVVFFLIRILIYFFRNPHCKLFNGGDSESGRLLIKDRVIWLSFRFRFIGGQLR